MVAAETAAFPTLLDVPAPRLRTYPKETVVAEKLQAMVVLGIANSRTKEFYDAADLARHFAFDGPLLVEAIQATFRRRSTPLPPAVPMSLTDAFARDRTKQTQWQAFLRKSDLDGQELGGVIGRLQAFAWPPLEAAGGDAGFEKTWTPPGPWE